MAVMVLLFVVNTLYLYSRSEAQHRLRQQNAELERELSTSRAQHDEAEARVARLTDALRRASDPSARGDAHEATPTPTRPCTARRSPPAPPPEDPRADPRSEVVVGARTRLTVLSPRLLRLEHLGASQPGGAFDDRVSTAVVNRRWLAEVEYSVGVFACELLRGAAEPARCLVVQTSRLRLEYLAPPNATSAHVQPRLEGGHAAGWTPPPPTRATLRVRIKLGEGWAEWWPGKPNPGQLPGTRRTLDKADGAAELECGRLGGGLHEGMTDAAHCEMGVVRRGAARTQRTPHAVRLPSVHRLIWCAVCGTGLSRRLGPSRRLKPRPPRG